MSEPEVIFRARPGNPERKPLLGYALALSGSVCFAGSATVAARLVRSGSPSWDVAQFRTLGTGAILAGIAICRPHSVRIPMRMWRTVAMFGIFGLLGTQAMFYAALEYIPVAVAGVLQQTGPMMVLVGALLVGRVRSRRTMWLAVLLAFGGVYLASGAYDFQISKQDALGIGFALLSAGCFAVYFTSGEALARWPARAVLTWGYLFAATVWLIVDIGRRQIPDIPSSTQGRVDLAIIVVFGTLIPIILNTAALRILGGPASALSVVATPVLSGLSAWAVLGQQLSAWQVFGGALALNALVWVQLQDIRSQLSRNRAGGDELTETPPEGS